MLVDGAVESVELDRIDIGWNGCSEWVEASRRSEEVASVAIA